MNLITDRQTTWNGGPFPKEYDTVKVVQGERKWYQHNDDSYSKKSALRRTLRSDYGREWIEEKAGKKRYFIDDGWFKRSIREVSKEEFAQKLDTPSTWQKVLGLGLGILALAPGVSEWARLMPKEAGLGLLALKPRNPLLGALGYSSIANAQGAGTEFQANIYSTGEQLNPDIAPLSNGGFIVIWQSNGQDGSGYGIYGQRYDDRRMPVGSEFQINTYTTSDQLRADVAGLSNGEFVVIWESNGQDGNLGGIFAKRYDGMGSIGSEQQINVYTTNSQQFPSIAALNSGGFVAIWQSNDQDGSGSGIFGRMFFGNGTASGSEFQVNTYTTNNQLNPSVAALTGGGFTATWDSFAQDGDGYGIYGQRFSANNTRLGTEFQINTYTTGSQGSSSIAALSDGGFIIVWESAVQDGDGYGIFGQRYTSFGTRSGAEFRVNTYTASDQRYPSVAALSNGGFVVVWQSNGQDGDLDGIFGQRYDASGAYLGAEFQVNTFTTAAQQTPKVAALLDGGFVVVWTSFGQDGNGYGIYGQRFDANGQPIGITTLPTQPLAFMTSISPSDMFSLQQGSTIAMRNSPESSQLPSSLLDASASPSMSDLQEVSTAQPETPNQFSSPIFEISVASSTSDLQEVTTSQLETSSQLPSSLLDALVSPSMSDLQEVSMLETSDQYVQRSSSGTIPVFGEITYGLSYTIVNNGQDIGTFSLSSGNVLSIEFTPNFTPTEGDVINLFSVPNGQENQIGGIQIEGAEMECLVGRGLLSGTSGALRNYQIIFEGASSCYSSGAQIVIPLIQELF